MPLLPNHQAPQWYFRTPAIVMDTCGVTWFLKRDQGIAELHSLSLQYSLIVPLPVLYEVGFGAPDKVAENEKQFAAIFSKIRDVPMMKFALAQEEGKVNAPGIALVNPGYEEWFSSRNRIIRHTMATHCADMKTQKGKLSLDALIHACGRNLGMPICTKNLDDFQKLNRAAHASGYDHAVPLFTPEQLLESLTSNQYSVE